MQQSFTFHAGGFLAKRRARAGGRAGLLLAAALLALAPAGTASAQGDAAAAADKIGINAADANPFAAALYVNGRAITNYEIVQRERFLQALEGPGDHRKEAVKALIDDKLRLSEAAKFDIKPSDEEIKAGMEEFASRAKMTADQFVAELKKANVDPRTFRDFVAAGQVWRTVVRGLVSPQIDITDADVKDSRALSLAHGVPRFLLSELIMPATPQYAQQTIPLAEQLSKTLKGDAAFAEAARKYSASDTAKKGGKLDWISASSLPNGVVQAVSGLSPGEISRPVAMPNAIGLFEMRGISDAPAPPPSRIEVDYAEYLLPGIGTAKVAEQAARVRARARTCNDLYGVAKGQPADVLTRVTQTLTQVPADVRLELAKLDPGESSTTLARGGNTVFLMLCSRSVTDTPPQSESDLRDALFGAKVNALADQKLDELRAAAIIRYP